MDSRFLRRKNMNTSGFYKYDAQKINLIYAPNSVYNKNFELHKEHHDEYDYPNNNWYWFNSRQEALDFYDITEEDLNPPEEEEIEDFI